MSTTAYPTATDRHGRVYHLLTTTDLPDLRRVGRSERAGCPIHGSDRQRSLSIVPDGEDAGFGQCFNGACQARVLVTDMNPEAVARLTGAAGERKERRITAADLLRPAQARTTAAEPEDWQRVEMHMLTNLEPRMRKALEQWPRARDYLAERGLTVEQALACGWGYIPPNASDYVPGLPPKWRDRLIIPLGSRAADGSEQRGYIGRSLHGWQPGMDENDHKRILDAKDRSAGELKAWGRRYEKTNPAGWFNYAALRGSDTAVIVEGAFDALALIECGDLADLAIIGLVGTACDVSEIPPNVRNVILGLDADKAGSESAVKLRRELAARGRQVALAVPPADDMGKDWAERWRVAQWNGIAPVLDALDAFTPPATYAQASPMPAPATDIQRTSSGHDDLLAEALADPFIQELMRVFPGFTLDVQPVAA